MNRWKLFYSNHKKPVIVTGSVLVVIILGLIFWLTTRTTADTQVTILTPKKSAPVVTAPVLVPSLTNGVLVSSDIANKHPVAVMIENSPPARPQTGLTSADIVYEAVTEGGITRFMAISTQNTPTKAGPVRSARSYFVDWLSEYDAFYAHVGGSPTALSRISQYGIKDASQDNSAYHREPQAGLASEHTDYVDPSQIYSIGVSSHKWPATFATDSWKFKDAAKTFGTVPKVTIDFSSSQFKVVWSHDPTTDTYSRVMDGVAHKDKVSGAPITAQTIVVITVPHSPNPPYAGTGKESEWTMTDIGSGVASVFQDGLRIDGTWKKADRTSRTRFYDSTGAEIVLDRGKIWVEVLPQTGTLTAPATTA